MKKIFELLFLLLITIGVVSILLFRVEGIFIKSLLSTIIASLLISHRILYWLGGAKIARHTLISRLEKSVWGCCYLALEENTQRYVIKCTLALVWTFLFFFFYLLYYYEIPAFIWYNFLKLVSIEALCGNGKSSKKKGKSSSKKEEEAPSSSTEASPSTKPCGSSKGKERAQPSTGRPATQEDFMRVDDLQEEAARVESLLRQSRTGRRPFSSFSDLEQEKGGYQNRTAKAERGDQTIHVHLGHVSGKTGAELGRDFALLSMESEVIKNHKNNQFN